MRTLDEKVAKEFLENLAAQDTSEAERRGLWQEWPSPQTDAILTHFMDRRPTSLYLTLSLKLHNPSWRKVQNILWAQRIFNNLIHAILEAVREDPQDFRPNGAFFCVREMLVYRAQLRAARFPVGTRSSMLADVLTECFTPPQDRVAEELEAEEEPKDTNQAAESNEQPRPKRARLPMIQALTAQDYPIIHTLRRAAFIRAAEIILGFYVKSQSVKVQVRQPSTEEAQVEQTGADDNEIDAGPDPQVIPEVQEMHKSWADQWERYLKAAVTPIPRGRDRGKAFGEALVQPRIRYGVNRGWRVRKPGKRRVRALQERLFTVEEVTSSLAHVYVLLRRGVYGEESEIVQEASRAKHLWRRDERYQRKTKASYIARYERPAQRERTSLDALSDDELAYYAEELLEMVDHAKAFDAVKKAIDIFLDQAPPSFPFVENAPFSNHVARDEHRKALRSFRKPVPPGATVPADEDHATLNRRQQSVGEKLLRSEQSMHVELLQAESELGDARLMPLSYARTMRPPDPLPTFALLYRKRMPIDKDLRKRFKRLPKSIREQRIAEALARGARYDYVLALVVHHSTWAFAGEDAADYFAPNLKDGDFYYVNFPDTPFIPPPNVSLMVFPLECGEEYHEARFLRGLIERLRTEQQADATLASEKPKASEPAAIGSFKLITRQNGSGWYECYAQFAVPVELPQCRKPETLLGVHRHQGQYHWAVLGFDGAAINSGTITVSTELLPQPGDTSYGKNYPPAVANAIIELAEKHNALIVIEKDRSHQRSHTAGERDRVQTSHPSRKIYDEVRTRTLQKGMMLPQLAYGVSPSRCGSCGNKLDNIRERRTKIQCQQCDSPYRSGYLQLPIAKCHDQYVWALLLREHPDLDRAKATADTIAWLIAEGDPVLEAAGLQPLAAGEKATSLEVLGKFVAQKRPAFVISDKKREYLAGQRMKKEAFQPRVIAAEVWIAADTALQELTTHWSQGLIAASKAATATSTIIEADEGWQELIDDDADIVLYTNRLSDEELHRASVEVNTACCSQCEQQWPTEATWLRCDNPACQVEYEATANSAITTARIGWESMIKGYAVTKSEKSKRTSRSIATT